MSIDHDGLFKLLISTFFIEFIELFLPNIAADIDKDSIEFLPEQVLIDITAGKKKIIDLLAKVKYKNQSTFFLVHVEAQSYVESEFAKRMFIYFSSLYKLYDLPIYPVVIFSFDEPLREEPACTYRHISRFRCAEV
ncbi:Rpn family recombination-promoting nuclease/putative transposase [Scytonema sp. NUACC26]|uniref:Rpn family recombination-promoting nuclease/putative transposase n=1 Tax=Scytonema sp. NUACC26 TaxID=3140176 RepID=UPI0034DC71EB